MARPSPTKSEREIESDLLVVRPYAIGIVTMGEIALCAVVAVFLFVPDPTVQGLMVTAITLFATQVIGQLLILAKQVETVHRVNSRMDELLEKAGASEYKAGKAQGRENLEHEQAENGSIPGEE